MPLDRNVIAKMSELLLKGERMLEEICPLCKTPLFYIKSKKMRYCPMCDIYWVSEEEAKKYRIEAMTLEEYFGEKKKGATVISPAEKGTQISEKVSEMREDLLQLIDDSIRNIIEVLNKRVRAGTVDESTLLKFLELLIKLRTTGVG